MAAMTVAIDEHHKEITKTFKRQRLRNGSNPSTPRARGAAAGICANPVGRDPRRAPSCASVGRSRRRPARRPGAHRRGRGPASCDGPSSGSVADEALPDPARPGHGTPPRRRRRRERRRERRRAGVRRRRAGVRGHRGSAGAVGPWRRRPHVMTPAPPRPMAVSAHPFAAQLGETTPRPAAAARARSPLARAGTATSRPIRDTLDRPPRRRRPFPLSGRCCCRRRRRRRRRRRGRLALHTVVAIRPRHAPPATRHLARITAISPPGFSFSPSRRITPGCPAARIAAPERFSPRNASTAAHDAFLAPDTVAPTRPLPRRATGWSHRSASHPSSAPLRVVGATLPTSAPSVQPTAAAMAKRPGRKRKARQRLAATAGTADPAAATATAATGNTSSISSTTSTPVSVSPLGSSAVSSAATSPQRSALQAPSSALAAPMPLSAAAAADMGMDTGMDMVDIDPDSRSASPSTASRSAVASSMAAAAAAPCGPTVAMTDANGSSADTASASGHTSARDSDSDSDRDAGTAASATARAGRANGVTFNPRRDSVRSFRSQDSPSRVQRGRRGAPGTAGSHTAHAAAAALKASTASASASALQRKKSRIVVAGGNASDGSSDASDASLMHIDGGSRPLKSALRRGSATATAVAAAVPAADAASGRDDAGGDDEPSDDVIAAIVAGAVDLAPAARMQVIAYFVKEAFPDDPRRAKLTARLVACMNAANRARAAATAAGQTAAAASEAADGAGAPATPGSKAGSPLEQRDSKMDMSSESFAAHHKDAGAMASPSVPTTGMVAAADTAATATFEPPFDFVQTDSRVIVTVYVSGIDEVALHLDLADHSVQLVYAAPPSPNPKATPPFALGWDPLPGPIDKHHSRISIKPGIVELLLVKTSNAPWRSLGKPIEFAPSDPRLLASPPCLPVDAPALGISDVSDVAVAEDMTTTSSHSEDAEDSSFAIEAPSDAGSELSGSDASDASDMASPSEAEYESLEDDDDQDDEAFHVLKGVMPAAIAARTAATTTAMTASATTAASSAPAAASSSEEATASASETAAAAAAPGVTSLGAAVTSLDLRAKRAVIGLANNGFDCYMISVLQSLCSLEPLVAYFGTDEFVPDVSDANKASRSGGKFAAAFNHIMCQTLSRSRPFLPRRFQGTVERLFHLSPMIQHDAQEFLILCLDELHESVNRVHVKQPAVEMPDFDDSQTDAEVAQRFAAADRARDDSHVYDLIQGQYKSTLRCGSCGWTKKKFDAYQCLSLEIPKRRHDDDDVEEEVVAAARDELDAQPAHLTPFSISLVTTDHKRYRLPVAMGPATTIGQLREALAIKLRKSASNLLPFIIVNGRVTQRLDDDDTLGAIEEDLATCLYVYLVSDTKPIVLLHHSLVTQRPIAASAMPAAPSPVREAGEVEAEDGASDPAVPPPLAPNDDDGDDDDEGDDDNDNGDHDAENAVPGTRTRLASAAADASPADAEAAAEVEMEMEEVLQPIGWPQAVALERSHCSFFTFYYMMLSALLKAQVYVGRLPETEAMLQAVWRRGIQLEWPFKTQDATVQYVRPGALVMATLLWTADSAQTSLNLPALEACLPLNIDPLTLEDVILFKHRQAVVSRPIAFEACLGGHLAKETIDDWLCPKCKTKGEATKQLALYALPQRVLIVQLKRFELDMSTGDMCKVDHTVAIPHVLVFQNGQLLSAAADASDAPTYGPDHVVFDLVSVCNHMGSMENGHYTSFAWRDGKWYHFDDNLVTRVDAADVATHYAYVLFYVRREPGAPAPVTAPLTVPAAPADAADADAVSAASAATADPATAVIATPAAAPALAGAETMVADRAAL
ncbi:hypothetical protein CXG81DRAFT_17165 [Caulochytrium protostelioides]|uniref:USP domain-containing protein n=1 Tax=Caulochytrium protostelioides TaxID=1555241 RepID=A0A4P9XCX2_9FUNG|nr:hypothetical protein CXG81DRAFT_17165 [Caulochytrium protostelioides]|eukprot:RKP03316.1 hypothetical protein CXG81DRAFT_17165 [Caulochytrium protostelioides]